MGVLVTHAQTSLSASVHSGCIVSGVHLRVGRQSRISLVLTTSCVSWNVYQMTQRAITLTLPYPTRDWLHSTQWLRQCPRPHNKCCSICQAWILSSAWQLIQLWYCPLAVVESVSVGPSPWTLCSGSPLAVGESVGVGPGPWTLCSGSPLAVGESVSVGPSPWTLFRLSPGCRGEC